MVPVSPEAEQLWIALMRGQRRVWDAIEADLKRASLPPLRWYDVLLELDRAEHGRLRPFDISRLVLFAQPNLSRLIDRLESEKLVERQQFDQDGRGQWIVITSKGRELRSRMWNCYGAAIQRHVGSKLNNEEAAEMALQFRKLAI